MGQYTFGPAICGRSRWTARWGRVPMPRAPGAGPGGYTYGDFGKIAGGPEVHADGEIWLETLWDLRGTPSAPR